MYNINNCQPCTSTMPDVLLPPPPLCEGQPCEEIMDSKCVLYNGPDIPCFNIVSGASLEVVIQRITSILCGCTTPTYTSNPSDVDIEVTITSTPGITDLYQVQYKLHSSTTWLEYGTETVGQYVFTITGLTAATQYDIRVRKVCANSTASEWETSTITTDS